MPRWRRDGRFRLRRADRGTRGWLGHAVARSSRPCPTVSPAIHGGRAPYVRRARTTRRQDGPKHHSLYHLATSNTRRRAGGWNRRKFAQSVRAGLKLPLSSLLSARCIIDGRRKPRAVRYGDTLAGPAPSVGAASACRPRIQCQKAPILADGVTTSATDFEVRRSDGPHTPSSGGYER